MRTTLIAPLILACLLSLGACNRNPASNSGKSVSANDPVAQEIKQIEYGVRLAAANKRIDELERKVGALETTPEKLDLDLLTQRVTTLEVKSTGGEALALQVGPADNASQPVRGTRLENGEVRRPFAVSSKLNLPELENRPRMATPAEAKAFSPGK